ISVKTAKETWQESPTDLVILYNNQILTLENIAEKETKYKALDNFIEPLINPQYLTNPELPHEEEFLVISEAMLSSSKPLVTIDGYSFHLIKSDDLRPLFQNRHILKIVNNEPGNLRKLVNYARQLFREEAEQLIKDLNFRKSHDDVISYPELQNYLSEEPWDPQPGQTSPYQKYITPSDPTIQKVSQTVSDKYVAYQLAKTWTWVSDSHLFNQAEKWLLPATFLSESPTYKTNPVSGTPASDCSEQANTLCSLMRTIGIPAEDVRVAIGKVNFDGTIGGHAWVEIKEDNQWLVLDPTSGPYFDDEQQRVISRNGVEYIYWKYHPYPIEEIWAYYNDQYFTDENAEVADGWATPYDVFLNEEMFAGFFSYDSQNLYFSFIIIAALSGIFLLIFVGTRLYNSKKP
ncbi:MAG: transglutaminase-like domain-containing protein, partial [Candidatus Thermoplasmatota archaeon]|nr:transglutaminase-like domain-containing protein [Candidatus Thermoplasmatota archaeon]